MDKTITAISCFGSRPVLIVRAKANRDPLFSKFQILHSQTQQLYVSSDDYLDKSTDFFGCHRNSSLARGTQDSEQRGERLWRDKKYKGNTIRLLLSTRQLAPS